MTRIAALSASFLLGALLLFPFTFPPQYHLNVFVVLFMYVALSSSWNILGGYTGYVSLGHTVFFGTGAYTTAILLRDHGLSPFLTAPVAGLLAAFLGLLIGLVSLRTRGPAFVIVTLALNFAAQLVALNLDITQGAYGISLPLPFWPVEWLLHPFYYGMLAVASLSVYVSYRVRYSKFGLSLLAIREDEEKAETLGINAPLHKIAAFVLSVFFVAVAGGLYSYFVTFIEPPGVFNLLFGLNMIIMTMIGGMGTVVGPVVGAAILVPANEAILTVAGSTELNVVISGVLLVVLVKFFPRGILGSVKVGKVSGFSARVQLARFTTSSRREVGAT